LKFDWKLRFFGGWFRSISNLAANVDVLDMKLSPVDKLKDEPSIVVGCKSIGSLALELTNFQVWRLMRAKVT